MTRNDRALRVLLTMIVVLLACNLLVNLNNNSGARTAYAAGIPDSGAQLQAIVDATNGVARKIDNLQSFLESGKLKVQVDKTDK